MYTCPSTDLDHRQLRAKQILGGVPEETAISPSLRVVAPSMICVADAEIRLKFFNSKLGNLQKKTPQVKCVQLTFKLVGFNDFIHCRFFIDPSPFLKKKKTICEGVCSFTPVTVII